MGNGSEGLKKISELESLEKWRLSLLPFFLMRNVLIVSAVLGLMLFMFEIADSPALILFGFSTPALLVLSPLWSKRVDRYQEAFHRFALGRYLVENTPGLNVGLKELSDSDLDDHLKKAGVETRRTQTLGAFSAELKGHKSWFAFLVRRVAHGNKSVHVPGLLLALPELKKWKPGQYWKRRVWNLRFHFILGTMLVLGLGIRYVILNWGPPATQQQELTLLYWGLPVATASMVIPLAIAQWWEHRETQQQLPSESETARVKRFIRSAQKLGFGIYVTRLAQTDTGFYVMIDFITQRYKAPLWTSLLKENYFTKWRGLSDQIVQLHRLIDSKL